MSGTWYAVARLRGTGAFNDHVMRITKQTTTGVYVMHTIGSRCVVTFVGCLDVHNDKMFFTCQQSEIKCKTDNVVVLGRASV